jgi:ubiquitin conjugation factor E4 B
MRGNAGHARSMLQYGHTFLAALIDFSAEDGRVRDAFMQPEIVSRLAPMLDYTLDTLAGPRCQELKVKDPKKVGFDPKQLLRQILSVFLNFAPRDEFAEAMARDERSYRRSIFEKAASIAERHMLKSPPELEQLMALVARVDAVQAADLAEEEDLGEIPDDFTGACASSFAVRPVLTL